MLGDVLQVLLAQLEDLGLGGAPLALVLRGARLEATQRSRQPLRGARCGIAAAVGLLLLLLPVLLLLRLCSRRRRVLEEQASHLREGAAL